MSYTIKILKNGCKQVVYTGNNSIGLLGSKYNGQTASIDGIYRINTSNYYNFGISLGEFKKYASIKSVKLRLYTPSDTSNALVYAKITSGYSTNIGLSTTTFTYCTDGYIETDITKLVFDNLKETLFLSLTTRNSAYVYNEAAPIGFRPELIVEYVDADQGLLKQKYIQGNVGDKQRFKVNIRNGQPFVSKKIYELHGTLMPLKLSLEYNGLDTEVSSFSGMPKGWKFNYQQKITSDGGTYVYIDDVGNKHTFILADNAQNIYYDIAGTGLILVVESGYKIIDCYHNELHFDGDGLLTSIIRKINDCEIKTSITYDSSNRIVDITDGMNRTISVVYFGSEIIVAGPGLETITIKMNADGYLNEILELDSRKTTYTFDEKGMLLTTLSDNGEGVEFTYDEIKRVSSVMKIVGTNEVILLKESLMYKPLTTFTTNYHNVSYEYAFSEEGEISSISEVNDNGDGMLESIINNDFETYKNVINKEVFLGFSNITKTASNNQMVSCSANYNSAVSQGDLMLEAEEEYVLSFTYKITGTSTGGSDLTGSLDILQGNTLLNKFELDSTVDYPKTVCLLFKTINNTIPIITLNYRGASEVFNISKIRIYKYDKNVEKVCLNYNSGGDYSVVAAGEFWNNIGDDFSGFIAGNIYTDKMYKDDLIENFKNRAIDKFSNYVWYNKKRGLVISDSVILKIGSEQVELSTIKYALVSQKNNRTYVSFSDYSANDCWKKDYIICKVGTEEFTSYDEFDINFLVKKTRNPRGLIKEYFRDNLGRVEKEVTGIEGGTTTIEREFEFQNNYLAKEITHLNGTNSSTSYDYNQNDGKLIKKTESSGLQVTYNYSAGDKLVKIGTTIAGQENTNQFEYNKDLVLKMIGNDPGFSLAYDKYHLPNKYYLGTHLFLEKENELSIFGFTNVEKSIYDHDYFFKQELDKYGRLVNVLESNDGINFNQVKSIYYSDLFVDDIEHIDNPNAYELVKQKSSKLRKIVDSTTGNTSSFYYNSDGNLSRVTNSVSDHCPTNIKLSYDNLERVVQKEVETSSNDIIITKIRYKDYLDNTIENIETEYNFVYENTDDSLTTTIYDSLKCELSVDRDAFGRVLNKSYLYDGQVLNNVCYGYLNNETKTTELISYEEHNDVSFHYLYDNFGRIVSITDDTNNLLTSYQYDLLGRLVRENNLKLNKTFVWTYDKNGNIKSRQETIFTTGTVDATPITYDYSLANKDELVKYNNKTVTSSLGTAITSLGDTQFQWSKRNKLETIFYSSGHSLTFEYNVDGVRTKKIYFDGIKSSTHNYILEGNKIIQEKISFDDTLNTLYYLYNNNEIVGFVYNQDRYYFQKNFRNDIIAIYNSSNNLVAKYVYDAWGNHKVYDASGVENNADTFIGNINPFRYRGYYFDVESKLYYCVSRYYNPEIGRWMCLDEIRYVLPTQINGLNLYSYCNNNPVMNVDFNGNSWILAYCAIELLLVTFGVVAVSDIFDEKEENIPAENTPPPLPLLPNKPTPNKRGDYEVPVDFVEMADSHNPSVYDNHHEYIVNNSNVMTGRYSGNSKYGGVAVPISFEQDYFKYDEEVSIPSD